jgi:DNA helicase-2/ATP-dependent DNA helicase PcrA
MANELEEIVNHIEEGNNFILSGGAGSGKTYTLVEVLKKIFKLRKKPQVACITFTNVAANEIQQRAPFENLTTSTIHEFLWDLISIYQNDIKKSLVELVNNETIRYSENTEIAEDYFEGKKIKYREWKKISEGIISHDEVIQLSEHLFENYDLLSRITCDRYDFILVDEYQDTFETVIKILLKDLNIPESSSIIGLFGDPMQSIYGRGVGSIEEYVSDPELNLEEVIKPENRRNPEIVIELINKIRNDGLIQQISEDESSPNYGVDGKITFLYSYGSNYDIEKIKTLNFFNEYEPNNSETKELYLVHNLIAEKAGFNNLYQIYDKDRIIGHKNKIRRHLRQNEIELDEDMTFGEVIDMQLVNITPIYQQFFEEHEPLYLETRQLPYSEIENIYLDNSLLIGQKNTSLNDERGNNLDPLISHLFNIQECIQLYSDSMFNEFIKKTHFQIDSIQDKIILKESIDTLSQIEDKSIHEVIEFADESGVWKKDDNFIQYITDSYYIYQRVSKIDFLELKNLYNYSEDYTPFSTQHNIKGAEFDNVFVILDNGNWNQYNFKYLFEEEGTQTVIDRTRKLFYVCCSRAKKNLIVFFHNPTKDVLEKAKEWFGSENTYNIT